MSTNQNLDINTVNNNLLLVNDKLTSAINIINKQNETIEILNNKLDEQQKTIDALKKALLNLHQTQKIINGRIIK
jgi:predicted RNase H-like nuclease (RuvC/YqgF family)